MVENNYTVKNFTMCTVFLWVFTPCRLGGSSRRFGEIYSVYQQGLKNIIIIVVVVVLLLLTAVKTQISQELNFHCSPNITV